MTVTENDLTPAEDLVMELLAARYRLGETAWTIKQDSVTTKTLRKLDYYGLVWFKSATTPGAYLCALTQAGQEMMLLPTYEPPVVKRLMTVLDEAYDEDCGLQVWGRHSDLKKQLDARNGGKYV